MPNINLSPYSARQASIDRRRALAQALQQQAYAPIEQPQQPGALVSPVQGAAKLAQALFASLGNRKLDKQEMALAREQEANRASQAMSMAQALGAPMQGENPIANLQFQDALAHGMASNDPIQQQMVHALLGQRRDV